MILNRFFMILNRFFMILDNFYRNILNNVPLQFEFKHLAVDANKVDDVHLLGWSRKVISLISLPSEILLEVSSLFMLIKRTSYCRKSKMIFVTNKHNFRNNFLKS